MISLMNNNPSVHGTLNRENNFIFNVSLMHIHAIYKEPMKLITDLGNNHLIFSGELATNLK